MSINPGDSHDYQGSLTLNDIGFYHFFITYQTSDGIWNTSLVTEGSAINTLDINVGPLPDRINAYIGSPVELRVYDQEGRITGLVKGHELTDIPKSLYYQGIVVLLNRSETYRYEVIGTATGLYDLNIDSIAGSEAKEFAATSLPIFLNAINDYMVDWNTLSQGQQGVTLQIDSNGDGTFERTIKAGSTLNGSDLSPKVPAISYWGIAGLVAIFGSSIVWILWRRKARART